MLSEYLWIVVVGGLLCFLVGFGIGANDVANNFGTSVGSKSISLKGAILIASIFELIGAVGLGASVTDAVRKGIYDPAAFGAIPDLLLTANMCALIATAIWLLLATHTGLPVSTTHSLLGSLIGCGVAMASDAVNWRYVGNTVAGWVVAPLVAMVVGALYFAVLRATLLRRHNGVQWTLRLLPALMFLLMSVFGAFFLFSNPLVLKNVACEQEDSVSGLLVSTKPCKVSKWVDSHVGLAFAAALLIGLVFTILLSPLVIFRAKRALKRHLEKAALIDAGPTAKAAPEPLPTRTRNRRRGSNAASSTDADSSEDDQDRHADGGASSAGISAAGGARGSARGRGRGRGARAALRSDDDLGLGEDLATTGTTPPGASPSRRQALKARSVAALLPWRGLDQHEEVYEAKEDARTRALNAEKFAPAIEALFTTLQVVSASAACVVHGSNDVANATSPFASIMSIYQNEAFVSAVTVPYWLLFLGGVGISAGLCVLGYKVIQRVGIELFYVSPARGFCVEMAVATVVVIGSFQGIPLSTTHIACGAMVGVALLDSYAPDPETNVAPKRVLGLNFAAVSWSVVAKVAVGWIGTLLVTGLIGGLLFAVIVYSPTNVHSRFTPCDLWNPSCLPQTTLAQFSQAATNTSPNYLFF